MCWLLVLSMFLVLSIAPDRYRYYVLGAYFTVCPVLLYKWSTMHQLIRMLDQREHDEKSHG